MRYNLRHVGDLAAAIAANPTPTKAVAQNARQAGEARYYPFGGRAGECASYAARKAEVEMILRLHARQGDTVAIATAAGVKYIEIRR